MRDRFTYNGKELQGNLNYLDYGARMYDATIGRWGVVDPLKEQREWLTLYNYVQKNPINRIEINGELDGNYYDKNGANLGSDGEKDKKVYVATRKIVTDNKDAKSWFENAKELPIDHDKFRNRAATVYAESSIGYGIESKVEMYAIASVLIYRNTIAYGANAPLAKKFLKTSLEEQTSAMETANEAIINTLTGGPDFSNGAKQWDGSEQTMVPQKDMGKPSNGSFMYKMNVMSWKMEDSHYKSWKSAIENKFGTGKFTVAQTRVATHDYSGMKNTGKIRLFSTAQYGLSIFWKEK
ncbi:RHS repeat domain-containing protein [Emticicia sp. 21SJ11W-3]|uniref:RHS repeat domain-containing protein n=1 Tax=Emticicia sp. 21SJ11W-3 TaxID=2916755 RepID=UPI0020A05B9E|nr:RHS repeat-associated core domain-containing protein [Emticicia sp. 21SJ11W-3]UTA68694.1 hypothetical protein MB380_02555 [Emticicia sp. 21SJ11W-3]